MRQSRFRRGQRSGTVARSTVYSDRPTGTINLSGKVHRESVKVDKGNGRVRDFGWRLPSISGRAPREATNARQRGSRRTVASTGPRAPDDPDLADDEDDSLCEVCLAEEEFGSAELLSGRVDLIRLIREGIPERDYVPGTEWLIRGKRYLTAAPAGMGKTLAAKVVAVGIVVNGGTVVVLDVENGADEYARRLSDILEAQDDTEAAMAACEERLRYYEFPSLSLEWSDKEWIEAIGDADLVIFDSSRRVLSSVGLGEDHSDDYAKFVDRLIVPLTRADIATWILDNTGHNEAGRARGTSAKLDLNEVVFSLSVPVQFDRETCGKVIWRRVRQRFSGVPLVMVQRLGGGTYELPQPMTEDEEERPFRPTYLMEQVSRLVEADPGKSTSFIDQHVHGKRTAIFTASQRLIEEGYVRTEDGPRNSQLHYSTTPYREAEDPQKADSNDQFPASSPTGSQGSGVDPARPVPPSGSSPRGRTAGTGQRPTGSPSGSREPQATTEPPTPSDHPLFGAEVEEADTPAESSEDGYHRLTEEEYVARFRERQARDQTDMFGGEPPT